LPGRGGFIAGKECDDTSDIKNLSSFIWSVADLLRGDYKQSEYGKVILPFTVLRRLDCVLEPTKPAVLAERSAGAKRPGLNPEPFLLKQAGQLLQHVAARPGKLMGDQDNIRREPVTPTSRASRPTCATSSSASTSTPRSSGWPRPAAVPGHREVRQHRPAPGSRRQRPDGLVFEELIRKFAELSNETAGEHFTPREVIRLMVNLLFIEDDDALTKPGVVRSLYDPTAGTGGMLSWRASTCSS
jgi:type I restriction enzyme M protein